MSPSSSLHGQSMNTNAGSSNLKNPEDSSNQQQPGHPSSTDPKLETIGGQIVSARKTLLNGDIETVYMNGTREIIKADKSEVRHMYR